MRFACLILLLGLAVPAYGQTVEQLAEQAAKTVLAHRFPAEAHRLEVRVSRVHGTLEEGTPVRVRLRDAGRLPRGTTQVDLLTGSDAAGWTKSGWAMLYVAHFDSVAVAAVNVATDEPVSPAALRFAWTEVTRFAGTPLRPADLRAMRGSSEELFADRRLHEGRALRLGDLRPAFAADTGTAVTMRYQRGPITLELRTKAREPGFAGEVIRVYAPDTDTVYRARLTAPGFAEWVETK